MRYDSIIVGAGVCGLCAALELALKGRKVLILEAQDYVGGRVKSTPIGGDVVFNEGAHWFHGGDINGFFQWAKGRYDLGPMTEDKGVPCRKVSFQGREVTEPLAKVTESFVEWADEHMNNGDFSLADMGKAINTPEARALIQFIAELWMAVDEPADIALRGVYEDPLSEGGWQLVCGMAHVAEQIAADVRKAGGEIKLNSPVLSVHNVNDGVEVRTMNEAYLADSSIVTIPIGVLKAKIVSFDKELQARMDETLGGFDVGNMYKAAFHVDPAYFANSDIPIDNATWIIDEEKPRYVHARTNGKNVITVFTGGTLAKEMEGWDEGRVKKFSLEVMASTPFFPDIEKSITGGPFTTQWCANKFTRGSYSVCRPGGVKCDPIRSGNVIVAGEMWLEDPEDSPGQMAGAFHSAQKAVKILLS